MTVSRALSGHPNVKPSTREKVLGRAHELGYVRNSAATAMRGEATEIVGLLLPNLVNEFYSQVANTLALLCADRNHDLVIHLTNDEPARERQSLLRLRALQASTVFMVPTPEAPPDAPPFPEDFRIIELIRTRAEDDRAGQLLIDDGPSIAAAAAHLIAQGHRRIGFIGASASMSSGRARLAAFRKATGALDRPEDPALVRTGAPGFAMGQEKMAGLLDLPAPPSAVICGGFEISNGALDLCLRRGVRFPGDLAFVGYGDPSFYRWICGGITTIGLSADAIAERAAGMLADTGRPGRAVVPAQFVIRHSA